MNSLKGLLVSPIYDICIFVIEIRYPPRASDPSVAVPIVSERRTDPYLHRVAVTAATVQQCGEFELAATIPALDLDRTEYLELPEIESVPLP